MLLIIFKYGLNLIPFILLKNTCTFCGSSCSLLFISVFFLSVIHLFFFIFVIVTMFSFSDICNN